MNILKYIKHINNNSFKQQRKNISVYVHWPYCASICPYCDFNKYLARDVDEDRMKSSYIIELEKSFKELVHNPQPVTSIFFGGGTPSIASPDTIASIISWIKNNCIISPNIEITLESNPSSVEASKLKLFQQAGVNRISLGIQALDDDDLKYLGRRHSKTEAIRAIEAAQSIYENVSIDLIYARHQNQTEQKWREELAFALSFQIGHLSLYSLTLEQGTPFHKSFLSKKLFLPEDDVVSSMYDVNIEEANKVGLSQYEVSNFCKPDKESLHNMNYWENGDFLGIGPGAAGRVTNKENKKIATSMIKHPNKWMDAVQSEGMGILEKEELSVQSQILESVLFGLRTIHGLNRNRFKKISGGKDFEEMLNMPRLQEYIGSGHLELDDSSVRATQKGLKILDSIIRDIT